MGDLRLHVPLDESPWAPRERHPLYREPTEEELSTLRSAGWGDLDLQGYTRDLTASGRRYHWTRALELIARDRARGDEVRRG